MSVSKKRLVVFLDGTWNDPTDNTNVWRLKTVMASRGGEGVEQLSYYDAGVGAKWYEKIRGGVGGYGLSENVQQAYRWLIENHDEEDEIFIFGFSRGAYTARSLAGLIATCGLPVPGSPLRVPDLYKRYREGGTPLYQLLFERRKRVDAADEWLVRYSRKTKVRFIGVWETVGTLGVPFGNIPFISRKNYRFHNTRISSMFEQGAQALALDEHRKAYDAVLWTNFIPKNPKTGEIIQDKVAEEIFPKFEQRWFIGAHSNVGGGYRMDLCAQVPLKWMQERAEAAGLAFSRSVELNGQEHLEGQPVDSFKRMLKGVYQVVRGFKRYRRPVGRPWDEKERGFVEIVNETIDPTVFERWQKNDSYRPKNLSEWAAQTGADLSTVVPQTSRARKKAKAEKPEVVAAGPEV